jgi:hypothetical protein
MWTGWLFKEGLPLEEAISETLPHLLGKSLECTLSLVLRETKARASHSVMGSRTSHPGSCNHHKSRGVLGNT